jgi:hypothetical protein
MRLKSVIIKRLKLKFFLNFDGLAPINNVNKQPDTISYVCQIYFLLLRHDRLLKPQQFPFDYEAAGNGR